MVEFKATRQTVEQLFKQHIATMKEGRQYRFTMEELRDEDLRREKAYKYFHLLRDRYAATNNYSKEFAKTELKYLFGINELYSQMVYENGELVEQICLAFEPPKRPGVFKKLYKDTPGEITFYQVTLNDYKYKELGILINGAIQACIDIGADIDDVVREYA